MSDLKPCPFCGGEAEAVHEINGFWTVECIKCGALVDGIAAWNSRAERTCEFTPDGMMDDRLWFSCSNCGGYITTDYGMPSYCPHCGAKVVGE